MCMAHFNCFFFQEVLLSSFQLLQQRQPQPLDFLLVPLSNHPQLLQVASSLVVLHSNQLPLLQVALNLVLQEQAQVVDFSLEQCQPQQRNLHFPLALQLQVLQQPMQLLQLPRPVLDLVLVGQWEPLPQVENKNLHVFQNYFALCL